MKRMLVAAGLVGLLAGGVQAGKAQAAPAAEPMATEHHEAKPGVPSKTLAVTAFGKTAQLSLADVQAMPQRTLVVHNGHSNVDETYSGVGLSELLAKYGLTLEGGGAKKVYHSYVRAEGTDGYWVLYSASELEAALHTGDAIVAISLNGKPLETDGAFKIVAGAEKKPARWVRNLRALTIVAVD